MASGPSGSWPSWTCSSSWLAPAALSRRRGRSADRRPLSPPPARPHRPPDTDLEGDPIVDGFATRAIHAGQAPDPATGAVVVPIYQTSTFAQEAVGVHKGYEYSRSGNPTRAALESCLASLEGGRHGLAFASGLAATDCVMHWLDAGDHVVVMEDAYGGTYRLFRRVYERVGLRFSFVDATNLANVEAAFEPRTRLVWLESPTNPLLKLVDIAGLAALAHERHARVAVDNTFM